MEKALLPKLTTIFSAAFAACGVEASYGTVVRSQRPDLCQFQCNGAMPAAKKNGKNPKELAKLIVSQAKAAAPELEISIAGPGFLNISIADTELAAHMDAMLLDKRLLCPSVAPKIVVIDFCGPNIAKAMHVGHLRSTVIGDCLQHLFSFMGDRVISDIHLGDWGTQMGMLIKELEERAPQLPYFDASFTGPYPSDAPVTVAELEEMYPTATLKCKNDPARMEAARIATMELQQGRPGYRALWQHFKDVSIKALVQDLNTLGVGFNLWNGESKYQEKIPAMLERLKEDGHTVDSQGAVVIPLKEEQPPLLLVKSDGGYLYATTDFATMEERVNDLDADMVLYVVDKRQSLHFEQLFAAAEKTGLNKKTKFEHIAFGTLNGPDGKPFKTRAGGVMKLHDLLETAIADARVRCGAENGDDEARNEVAAMVALAALKFADLSNVRTSDYAFDMDKFMSFEGKTGPYLLYAAVRIKSLLKLADEKGLKPGKMMAATETDRKLMLELSKLPEVVQAAYLNRAPHILCEHAFSLAQVFSEFYHYCPILGDYDGIRQASRLALAQLCQKQLELLTTLLGISIPQKMFRQAESTN